jgi:chorismate mutase
MFSKRPFIISGPCSAETEEQLLQTALQLKATGMVDLFRAGIWKPRTRPGQFEGIGSIGLEWMNKVKKVTGFSITTEVANSKQVEEALKNDIDVLWLGARTVANPFSVQEIANVLQGVNVPILIKNPTNPDLELWTGAVERIAKAGITNIGLVHRGFSVYGATDYRNSPMWHLAIEMKRRYFNLPFICDPSHIGGRRDILANIAQTSINLGYDGIMIEAHINPDDALSDAQQQITPTTLHTLLQQIIWRNEKIDNADISYIIEKMRLHEINHLDDELMDNF